MLVRIVKMSFIAEMVPEFLDNFDTNKEEIRNFSGCKFLELYRDKKERNIFFTYSHWENESDLNAYRKSDLFRSIWKVTKAMFNDKPRAWSVEKMVSIP